MRNTLAILVLTCMFSTMVTASLGYDDEFEAVLKLKVSHLTKY